MNYPSLAEFKSSVCVTINANGATNMSLPLVIEQIFNAQPGCAFPEEMGKQTKIELTTGRTHKPKGHGAQTHGDGEWPPIPIKGQPLIPLQPLHER